MSRALKWSIPGIKKIFTIKASEVPPGSLRRYRAGLPVMIPAEGFDIDILDVPTCNVAENHRLSGVAYSATLRFTSPTRVSDPEPKVWIIVDNEDRATMLGMKEAPYPRMEADSASGEFSGRKAISYEVKCSTEPIEVVFS